MTTDKISSVQFFKAWIDTVQGRKDHMLNIWRKQKEYTSHIKGDDSSIMKEIADKLNLICYQSDYYSIDTVLYKQEDLVPGIPEFSYWFRDMRVAFEHENNFNSGLFKEVSHLLITNCDLRVLVSYPIYEGDEELEYLHNVIIGNRQSKIISEDESFLIIFGYIDFTWEGFVYKDDGWKSIQEA